MWDEQEQEDADRFIDRMASGFFDILKAIVVLGLAYFVWRCGNA